MGKLIKDKAGRKLYPVCSFQRNQHKLVNALDRARLREYDEGYTDEIASEIENIEAALTAFNGHVVGDTVYATYTDSKTIKELIAAYDLRGDLRGFWKEDAI